MFGSLPLIQDGKLIQAAVIWHRSGTRNPSGKPGGAVAGFRNEGLSGPNPGSAAPGADGEDALTQYLTSKVTDKALVVPVLLPGGSVGRSWVCHI